MTPRLIMKLEVAAVADAAPGVRVLTFRHRLRPALPEPEPGAHVDLHLPDGRVRQYSLCGDPADATGYTIAVKLEPEGRGGSRWVHQQLQPGAVVPVSAPRNHFRLADEARQHVLVAGGIGITPIAAMARHLARCGAAFELHYCVRDEASAPLLPELQAACGTRLHLWRSGGDVPSRFDPHRLSPPPQPGTHLYCCGPHRLVDAVLAATAGWPTGSVHVEHFAPLYDAGFVPEAFQLGIASTGATLEVPAGRSALDVLREHGFMQPSSCGIGVCGACECGYRVADGSTVIHRDVAIDDTARAHRMTPCVSRARGRVLLDL